MEDYLLLRPNQDPVFPVTDHVDPAEYCLRLWEEDRHNPADNQRHRYQMIAVVRGDKPAVHTSDLGPSNKFKGLPFFASGAIKSDTGHTHLIHTVSQLMYHAEYSRETPHTTEWLAPDYGPIFEEIKGRNHGN